MTADPVLSVRDLTVTFAVGESRIQAVRGISYDLHAGEILCVVGESGSGKSAGANALLRLLPPPPRTTISGEVMFENKNLLTIGEKELRAIRGKEIAMIFQDPASALNPVQTVGSQIAEALLVHDNRSTRKARRARVVELLDLVGVPSPEVRYGQFPHEFSGGMRQRAMIALALANNPKVLIADEPTTALDVTIQAQILDLLQSIREETGAATILITHDLGLVAEVADRVLVMYAGKVVETGDVLPTFQQPRHPYTLGLMASLPRLDTSMDVLFSIPGQPPSMSRPPSGCAFHPRCDLSRGREVCRTDIPELRPVSSESQHLAACHFTDEMEAQAEAVREAVGVDVRAEQES